VEKVLVEIKPFYGEEIVWGLNENEKIHMKETEKVSRY
jgi:hypothetical protein